MATEWNEGAIVGGAVVAIVAALARLIIGWWRHKEGGTSILITQEEKHFGYYQTQLADARGRIKDLEDRDRVCRETETKLAQVELRCERLEYRLRDVAFHAAVLDDIARDHREQLIKQGVMRDNIPPMPRWIRDLITKHRKEKENGQ